MVERNLYLTKPYMTGEDVRQVQQRLGINADGVFGPGTQKAVIKFQTSQQIASDGIVGKVTRDLLNGTGNRKFNITDAEIYDAKLNSALNANVGGLEKAMIYIKAREELRLKAHKPTKYDDWTIGYGHKNDGGDVEEGDTMTK